jgi:hypothetical protein
MRARRFATQDPAFPARQRLLPGVARLAPLWALAALSVGVAAVMVAPLRPDSPRAPGGTGARDRLGTAAMAAPPAMRIYGPASPVETPRPVGAARVAVVQPGPRR